MTEQTFKQRVRVNYEVSTKGVVSPSVTFEGYDMDEKEVLMKATQLLDLAQTEASKRSKEAN